MQIAFVVEHCHLRGGHERCVAEWARRLARRHEVTIVSHSVSDLPPGAVRWEPIHRIPGPAPLQYLAFYLMAGARVKKLRGHIIHSQGPNCPVFDFSSVHTVVRAKYRVLRGSPEFRRELTVRQYASWDAHYRLAMAIERRLYPRPEGILLPVSKGAGRELHAHFGTAAERIVPVPNGVDLDVFRPGMSGEREATLRTLGLEPQGAYALFVGGEWARKGLPFALRVIAESANDIHLVVAGSGPQAYYREQAARLGIQQRVHFLGTCADTSALYRTGLALLMPSLYEAFSLVSLEAAASGLPILASPVSGTEELIEEGQNGWVLPADPTLWAARLNALAADRGIHERMSHHAREVASLFPWDRGVARFEELYAHGNT